MEPSRTPAPAPSQGTGSSTQQAAIDHVLRGVDARMRHQHRIRVQSGEQVGAPIGGVTLVYVIEGSLRLCARSQVSHAASSPRSFTHTDLETGDALVCSGIEARMLSAAVPSLILRSRFDIPKSAAPIWSKIPATFTVRSLPLHEPNIAALASTMAYTPDNNEGTCAHERGNEVVCRMMANTLLVALIRAWSVQGCAPVGWPAAASDPFLDRVVEAVQADPGHNWTLAELARVGTMSRSSFAKRFRDQLGITPANYVTQVRVASAQDLLARGCSVTDVSRSMGYETDDGFRRAFTRSTGMSPSTWTAQAV